MKLIFSKYDEVGVVLYGTRGTVNPSSTRVLDFSRITMFLNFSVDSFVLQMLSYNETLMILLHNHFT